MAARGHIAMPTGNIRSSPPPPKKKTYSPWWAYNGGFYAIHRREGGSTVFSVLFAPSLGRPSLVPSPSPHVRERESGVLSDFSCHMGRGSSPI